MTVSYFFFEVGLVVSLGVVMLGCNKAKIQSEPEPSVEVQTVQNSPKTLEAQSMQNSPKTLDEAHLALERELSQEVLRKIDAMESEDGMVKFHFGLGMSLRNKWGLWKGSALALHLRGLGFTHPDDMSTVILETFWCKRHRQPFRLKARAEAFELYWCSQEKPGDDITDPRDGSAIKWASFTLHTETSEGEMYSIHAGQSRETKQWVAHDCIKGVYIPDEALLTRIKKAAE